MLRGGSFTGREGIEARGIYNLGSATLEAESVTALGENGSGQNHGLINYTSAEATLRGGSYTGRGGPINRGIYSLSGTANVTQSVLEGASRSVCRSGGAVTISNSRLIGGSVGGAVTCVAVSHGTTFYAGTCP